MHPQANNPNNKPETTQHNADYDFFGKILNKTQVDQIIEATKLDLDDLIDGTFESDWLLVDEAEREELMIEFVENNAWVFTPTWLSNFTCLPKNVFEKLQELRRDANEATLAIIERCGPDETSGENKKRFAKEAVETDGYGHFLNLYDGYEYEIDGGDKMLFLYRLN